MTEQSTPSEIAGEVFISYSWDSEDHMQKVLALANRQRSESFDCVHELLSG